MSEHNNTRCVREIVREYFEKYMLGDEDRDNYKKGNYELTKWGSEIVQRSPHGTVHSLWMLNSYYQEEAYSYLLNLLLTEDKEFKKEVFASCIMFNYANCKLLERMVDEEAVEINDQNRVVFDYFREKDTNKRLDIITNYKAQKPTPMLIVPDECGDMLDDVLNVLFCEYALSERFTTNNTNAKELLREAVVALFREGDEQLRQRIFDEWEDRDTIIKSHLCDINPQYNKDKRLWTEGIAIPVTRWVPNE